MNARGGLTFTLHRQGSERSVPEIPSRMPRVGRVLQPIVVRPVRTLASFSLSPQVLYRRTGHGMRGPSGALRWEACDWFDYKTLIQYELQYSFLPGTADCANVLTMFSCSYRHHHHPYFFRFLRFSRLCFLSSPDFAFLPAFALSLFFFLSAIFFARFASRAALAPSVPSASTPPSRGPESGPRGPWPTLP